MHIEDIARLRTSNIKCMLIGKTLWPLQRWLAVARLCQVNALCTALAVDAALPLSCGVITQSRHDMSASVGAQGCLHYISAVKGYLLAARVYLLSYLSNRAKAASTRNNQDASISCKMCALMLLIYDEGRADATSWHVCQLFGTSVHARHVMRLRRVAEDSYHRPPEGRSSRVRTLSSECARNVLLFGWRGLVN